MRALYIQFYDLVLAKHSQSDREENLSDEKMRTRNSATSAAVTSLIDDSSSSNYQSLDPLPSSAKSSYDHYRQCNLSMETSSDLPTDLRLGLGIGISSTNFSPKYCL